MEESKIKEEKNNSNNKVESVIPISKTPQEDRGKEVISEYFVFEPYQKIQIISEYGHKKYIVVEPAVDEEDLKTVNHIKEFIEYMDENVSLDVLKDKNLRRKYIEEETKKILKKKKISSEKWDMITYYIVRDLAGYGKIDALMRDDFIEDISCSGPRVSVYVWHRKHGYIPTNIYFTNEDEMITLVYRLSVMARKMISVANPTIEGILPGGSRIVCNLDVVSLKGPSFTIRKYSGEPMSVVDLIRYGSFSPELAAYFWMLMEAKKSTVISGEVGAGKTTLSNAILGFIPKSSKIITVEETPEIRLDGYENWEQKITRESVQEGVRSIDLFELVKTALRERPDYVIVGEVRGRETYVLFQSIALGHGGLTTIHADDIESAVKRMTSKPLEIPLYLISLASSFAHIRKFVMEEGNVKRRVTDVKEIEAVKDEKIRFREVFKYFSDEDEVRMVNESLVFKKICTERGISVEEFMREFRRRETFLALLSSMKDITWKKFTEFIEEYYINPKGAIETARLQGGL